MADDPSGKKRSLKQRIGGWIYGSVSRGGWSRFVLFIVALIILILAVMFLRAGSGYREEPSSLVPRRASFYIEARQLGTFLNGMGTLKIWTKERLEDNVDGWSSLQQDINDILIGKISGLSTRPRKWLSSPNRAAFCIDSEEDGSGQSWAMYFNVETPSEVLADIAAEPGVVMEKIESVREDSVHKMTDRDGRQLYLGAVGPWLIISSDANLPDYALKALRKPSLALVGSGMLPDWSGKGAAVRGLYDPERRALSFTIAGFSQFSSWLVPDMRVTFTGKLLKNGGMETTLNSVTYNERGSSGGMWPVFAVILVIIGLACLCIILAIILCVIGLGGWIKAAAIRAGVLPAKKPEPVEPSPAFKEDAGLIANSEQADENRNESTESQEASLPNDSLSDVPSTEIESANTPLDKGSIDDNDTTPADSSVQNASEESTSFESGIEQSPPEGESENGEIPDSDTNKSK